MTNRIVSPFEFDMAMRDMRRERVVPRKLQGKRDLPKDIRRLPRTPEEVTEIYNRLQANKWREE